MDLLAAGCTSRQILDQCDHLTAEDVQACLAYAKEVIRSERVYAVKKSQRAAAHAHPHQREPRGTGDLQTIVAFVNIG
jgi:hypothetical protein